MIELKMPDIAEEIAVKVISLPYIRSKDVFVKVVMYGEPKKYEFEMKIGKTLWYSIYEHLKKMEDDDAEFSEFLGESTFKIDESLSFLKDRVITIRGVPDMTREFVSKDGNVTRGKKFVVVFESELEDAESVGGDTYTNAVIEKVIKNVMAEECRLKNARAARDEILRKEDKEKEKLEKKEEKKKTKELTKEEKKKKDWENSKEPWVVKKREKDKKEAERQKKLVDCGW